MAARLPMLGVKLLRDGWRLRAQAMAITLIIAGGIGMVIMSMGMITMPMRPMSIGRRCATGADVEPARR